MALIPGTRFGPYEIQSLLGAGGMGEVYRALDTRLQRTVAIKILPAHLSSNPELHARFAQEAKSISGLQHPNICVVHDIGSQDGIDFMVMEYVAGQTLDKLIPAGGLVTNAAIKYAIQAAEALLRTRLRHRASRSEALEHHGGRERAGQSAGFWAGQDCSTRVRAERSCDDSDDARNDRRHSGLYVAGAS